MLLMRSIWSEGDTMQEIIKIKNASYGRYEELLLRLDSLKKKAINWKLSTLASLAR